MQAAKLLQHYFECTPDEPGLNDRLRSVVADYPYFTLGHYCLALNTGDDHVDYERILSRTSLHSVHPYVLQYRLEQAKQVTVPDDSPAETAPATTGEAMIHALAEAIQQKSPEPQAEPVTELAQPEQPALLFEPLHTTDYFASQGIKLSDAQQQNDKLGRQLKSFTEWLKTMKKIPAKTAEPAAALDPAVEHMAEKSNKETDVYTEAMAEVLIQQGKSQKAKEVYEKLLLLNPAKSVYFAAKIDDLNKN